VSFVGQFAKDVSFAFNKLARPTLTVMIAAVFNGIAAWAFFEGRISWEQFATAIGPTNSMIIGFWFGEKSALKVPVTAVEREPEET
jgi:hypothetical protein